MQSNGDGERDTKRVRQACLNCRKKKTRCSGEKPICAFCERLGQECHWDDPIYLSSAMSTDSGLLRNSSAEANLAARVGFLESKLAMLDAHALESNDTTGHKRPRGSTASTASTLSDSEFARKTSSVPDLPVLHAAADVYLRHCWNQPYCYFDGTALHERITNGILPTYFLLALLATAARFSEDPFFEGRQTEAVERYARQAWDEISEQSFSSSHSLNICTVQATCMLGAIDFVRKSKSAQNLSHKIRNSSSALIVGRPQLAWVKIGLSVRFAQSLGLTNEPDMNLPPILQEEHRRTFWSVYLLDRLVSCGPNRPPTLQDEDCTVRLPSSGDNYPTRASETMPTLASICDIPEDLTIGKENHFCLTIFMTAILGRIVRHSFVPGAKVRRPPWDSRSEFSRIYGLLLSFESYSHTTDPTSVVFGLTHDFNTSSGDMNSSQYQFIFSIILYHLNHCLLHHPLLIRQNLKSYPGRVPPSFLEEARSRCVRHARSLAILFETLRETDIQLTASFYGYAATIAAGILKLRVSDSRGLDFKSDQDLWHSCLRFLDQSPSHWQHYLRMSTALRSFDPSPTLSSELFSSTMGSEVLYHPQCQELNHLIDYGWLSHSDRPITASQQADNDIAVYHEVHLSENNLAAMSELESWNDFGPQLGSLLSRELGVSYHDTGTFPPDLMAAMGGQVLLGRNQSNGMNWNERTPC